MLRTCILMLTNVYIAIPTIGTDCTRCNNSSYPNVNIFIDTFINKYMLINTFCHSTIGYVLQLSFKCK